MVVHVYAYVGFAFMQVITAVFQYVKMLHGASTAQLERCAYLTCLSHPTLATPPVMLVLCLQSFICKFRECLWVGCVAVALASCRVYQEMRTVEENEFIFKEKASHLAVGLVHACGVLFCVSQ